jgi:hypothetical protein
MALIRGNQRMRAIAFVPVDLIVQKSKGFAPW